MVNGRKILNLIRCDLEVDGTAGPRLQIWSDVVVVVVLGLRRVPSWFMRVLAGFGSVQVRLSPGRRGGGIVRGWFCLGCPGSWVLGEMCFG